MSPHTRTTRTARLSLVVLLLGTAFLGTWTRAADEEAPRAPTGVVATLKGHTESVYAIAYSPDGKQVVTGSWDQTLNLWDAATGKKIKTFGGAMGHQKMLLAVAFHPNGHSIASGSADNTAKVWDVPSDSPLQTFLAAAAVNGIALSPDGTKLAAAGKDGNVTLWTPATGKKLFTLSGHKGPVTGVAFNSNGQTLVSSGSDNSLRFWNTQNGQGAGMIGAHSAAANAVMIHPNNAVVYSAGSDGTIKAWQIPQPASSRRLPAHTDAVNSLALSPDGGQLLSGGADKVVRLSNFFNGQQLRLFPGAAAAVRTVAYAPNGATVAAGTEDRQLLVWNAANGTLLGRNVAHGGPVAGIAFHPQSTQFVTAGGDGLIKIWAPSVAGKSLTHPEAVRAAVLTGDGRRLFTGGADKTVRSWNLTNNQMERQYTGHAGAVTAIALSGNGQNLVSGGADQTIRFWNQNTGKEASSIGGHSATVTSLSFSPSGQQLLSSSEDGTVKLWQLNLATPKPLLHTDKVTSVAVSPDGARLLTGCGDKQVRLWNLASGQMERAFPGNTQAVNAVAFNFNATAVAAAGADKSLTVWTAANAQVIKKIALPAIAYGIAFSPDGKQVAAALDDKTVRLYDLAKGTEVKSFTGHTDAANAVAFTPKGDRLVSGSADKTVRVWNVADASVVAKLEHGAAVSSLAVSKDGGQVVSAGKDKAVKVWALADEKKPLATITSPAEITSVGLSADGKRVVVGGTDNRVRVYGTDGKLVEFFAHDGKVLAVAYHGDGKRVISASADKTARVWTLALIWSNVPGGAVRQAVFSPKGNRVAAGGKTLKVWNAADGKEVKSIAAHKGLIVGVGLSTDGMRLVSAGSDKSVKVWDLTPPKKAPVKGAKEEEDKPLAEFNLGGEGEAAAEPQQVAISPNGTRVAVAVTVDKTNPIQVYDVATGKELQVISDHKGAVHSLQFQADNRTLVSASADKTARISDVGVLRVIEAHKGGVTGVQFHSNGTIILTGGTDKTVKLWEAATGKLQRTFVPLDDAVSAVAFSRNYAKVGAAAGKLVRVWDATNGKELLTLTHPSEVTSLSFSSDNTKVVTGAADNKARIWDAVTGKELQFFSHAGAVRAVVFHNNGTMVVSAGADKTVEVNTLLLQRVIPAGDTAVRALSLAPSQVHLISGADDGAVKLWNVGNGNSERVFAGAQKAVHAATLSRNGFLAAAAGADKVVRVYNFADAKLLRSFKAPGVVRGLNFSPNSQTLAAACEEGSVVAWNVVYTPNQPLPIDFGKKLQTFTHTATATEVVFAPDNVTLYSGSQDKSVKSWKVASEAPTRNLPHPNHVDAVAFNSTGTELATAGHDGVLRIYDVAKGQLIRQVNAHVKPNNTAIYCLAWSPDDKQIVTGSIDYSLKLWTAATGALVREFKAYQTKVFEKGHNDSVYCVAFSPDGKWLASGGAERVIKLWNVADGSVIRDFVNPKIKVAPMTPPQSHPGWVYTVRFTKDGKQLVSVGDAPQNKGYLAMWSTSDGKLLHGAEMSYGAFYSVAISPNGKNLALGVGLRGRGNQELNTCYIIKMPGQEKK